MCSSQMINEINQAIGAHGRWKMRLRTAIATGQGELDAAVVCRDDQCAFGQWLHGPAIDAATRAGIPYGVVRRLHAEFHQSAGKVVTYVEQGRKDLAGDIMVGEFAERSDKLIRALNKWKNELHASVAAAVPVWAGQDQGRIEPVAMKR